ncbi:hypothetical protein V1525DRAFT_128743 [Lipomyces kononenkoae]|uniref:Uncharacterized protein n=1 Tax=Lipomyces kononenkoae TaxID=34357 RepID=A0ACC3SQ20_LIPKO
MPDSSMYMNRLHVQLPLLIVLSIELNRTSCSVVGSELLNCIRCETSAAPGLITCCRAFQLPSHNNNIARDRHG